MKTIASFRFVMAIKVIMTILCSSILNGILVVNATGGLDDKYYNHSLSNGTNIVCQKCKPGMYFIMDCTVNGQEAICLPCKNGTYQPEFRVARSCAPCSTCKYPEFEYVSKACTTIADTLCICKDGYYRETKINLRDALCLKDKPCPIGYKVSVKGNGINATTCVLCPDGYFSDTESFTENCTQCRVCDNGIDMPCNASIDTKCKGVRLTAAEIVAIVLSILVFIVICVLLLLYKVGAIGVPCRNCQNYLSKKYKKVAFTNDPDKCAKVLVEQDNHIDVVSDKELLRLSKDLICSGWEMLFHELFGGNATQHIERMNLDNKDIETKIYKLLITWKSTEPGEATKMQLTKVLCARQMNNLAERYFPQEYAQYSKSVIPSNCLD